MSTSSIVSHNHRGLGLLGLAVAFLLAITLAGEQHPFLDRSRAPRWTSEGSELNRKFAPLEYMGGIGVEFGGIDVYEAKDGGWWLVGPGRRFTPCWPIEARDEAERLFNRERIHDGGDWGSAFER